MITASVQDRLRKLRRDHSGFTLIEVVVAMGLIMVISAALAYGMITTNKAQRVDESRNAAVQLAKDALATAVTGGWLTLGFYQNDPGYRSGVSYVEANGSALTEATVSLGSTAPSPRPQAVPWPVRSPAATSTTNYQDSTLTVHNIAYTVRTDVTWYNQTAAPTYGQKRVSSTVTWTLDNVTRSVNQQTLVSPNPSDMKPTYVPNVYVCEPQRVGTPVCGLSVADGMVSGTSPTAGAKNDPSTYIVTNRTITMTASVKNTVPNCPSLSSGACSVTVQYQIGVDSSGNPTYASVSMTPADGTGQAWSASIPSGTTVVNGWQNLPYTVVVPLSGGCNGSTCPTSTITGTIQVGWVSSSS